MTLPRHEQRILREIERELERDSPELLRLTAILRSRHPDQPEREEPEWADQVRHAPGRYDFPLGRWEVIVICGAVAVFAVALFFVTVVAPYIR
ncbi:DUF3040 domain-containing protein [Thermostaphylospora chromogena]|uniref:DUF3040 domain-containing protein n=1 Tax=Thermostaphylospora chromogena TaxID=35622 RepID=A0A1H1D970_9ACTN|nr:DUF3040 domain-containing protein [Thermostaphylospora chromogena]SDQ73002.1 Protein of unknown function [Thermostaphylospora chromogena]